MLTQSDAKGQVSLGAHIYGGKLSSASVIGQYGNDYSQYLKVLMSGVPKGSTPHSVPLAASKPLVAPITGQTGPQGKNPLSGSTDQNSSDGTESFSGEEGLLDILGTGLSVFGGPYGAVAGIAINAAGQLLAKSSGAESLIEKSEISVERAILAEATLSAIQSGALGKNRELHERILQDIKSKAATALPVIRKVVDQVMGTMLEPALKIALQSLRRYNTKQQSGQEGFVVLPPTELPITEYTEAVGDQKDQKIEAFIGRLNKSLQKNLQESVVSGDTQEAFRDIFKAGLHLGSGVLGVAKQGLPILVDYLNKYAGAEAFGDQIGILPVDQYHTAFQLAKRAVAADAALQAVLDRPASQFQEGFIDSIINVVKTVAPVVIKAAPAVAKAIDPAMGKVVSSVFGTESAPVARPKRIPGRISGLSSKPSKTALGQGGFSNTDADSTAVPKPQRPLTGNPDPDKGEVYYILTNSERPSELCKWEISAEELRCFRRRSRLSRTFPFLSVGSQSLCTALIL